MSGQAFTLGEQVHAEDTLQRRHIWNPATKTSRKEWRYLAAEFDIHPEWARKPITGMVVGIRTLVDGRVDYTGDSIEFVGDTRRRAVQIVDSLNHAPRMAWIEDVTEVAS